MDTAEQVILRILARLLRSQRIFGPFEYEHKPLKASEARKIYFYYRLGGVLPLRGFAERLNSNFAPCAMMARDLVSVYRMRYYKTTPNPAHLVLDTQTDRTCKGKKNKGTITKAAAQKPPIRKRRAKNSDKKHRGRTK